MFNRFTSLSHLLRVLIQALLDRFENVFVFPASNSAFLACGALIFDCAAAAGVDPVTA